MLAALLSPNVRAWEGVFDFVAALLWWSLELPS